MKKAEEKKIRSYEKPRLRVIELVADEVMAVGCKTVGQPAPGRIRPPCNPCGQRGS